jgi:hypothetical protein
MGFADLWGKRVVADVPGGGGCGLALSMVDGPRFRPEGRVTFCPSGDRK